ncbi:hypothetical protein [Vibrio tapetis]|uniref:Uncharacterized protein n=1 Tax=Vibrio tapetis subsp. tapetis TaxID=1671868 RepID=A0A2N8ZIZ2_9VIBR|nr:hypothetical protein [Vibrio tapetis]SON51870.1 conserved exported protein of unknown function [Vibrio tapetis subsp. tapetis]
MNTPMAISSFLGWFFVIVFGYPLALVGLQIAIFDKRQRDKITRWFNIVCAFVVVALIVMHMQTEVIFGKELLDAWYNRTGSE